MGTMVGANLYVLKDHVLVSVSIGTTKDHSKRREKAIALARLVVGRL